MVVVKAQGKSSILPEGSDWTTVSPFLAVQIGIQLAGQLFFARMYISTAKHAVPVLLCPLALACLLLHLFIGDGRGWLFSGF